jgi:hypothetical protein
MKIKRCDKPGIKTRVDFSLERRQRNRMKATEVTVQLPKEEAEFLETYAREHATSVAEIFARYARRLHSATRRTPHPESVKFSGSVPTEVDVREAYRKQMVDKHR